jgi:hypothetical protein
MSTTHLTRCKFKASHTLALILAPTFVGIVRMGFKAFTRGGFHQIDNVCSFHHLPKLPTCFSFLHLAIARRNLFFLLLVLETYRQIQTMQQLVVHVQKNQWKKSTKEEF